MRNAAQAIRQVLSSELTGSLPIEQRDTFIAIAIARALSVTLNLPSSPVTSITAFYASTHNNTVAEIVSSINEELIIDCKMTCDLVHKLYKVRYQLAFEPMAVMPLFGALTSCCSDVVPPPAAEALAKFMTPQAEDSMNQIVFGIKTDFAERGQEPAIAGSTTL